MTGTGSETPAFLTGIGSGDWHAIKAEAMTYALTGPAYSVAFAACGELVRVAEKYGTYDRGTQPVMFSPCQPCAWTVAVAGGSPALEAEIGRLPTAAVEACRAILARIGDEEAGVEWDDPETIQLLATVAAHAPVDLVGEACADGDCEHPEGECPSSATACLACSVTAGDWAGEWEGRLRPEGTIKAPCAVLLALAGDPR
jgi:hypothetical protein